MSNYNFPPHKKGDTFNGIQFSLIKNDVPIDLTDVDIKMDVRNTDNELLQRFTDTSGLSIQSPATGGIFFFDRQIIDIDAGKNSFDIEFTFPTGEVKTYIWGYWLILQDVTYD